MATDIRDLQATCEDYLSDESDEPVVLESFRRSPAAAGQANVAAKRSHPSDLGIDRPVAEKVGNIDLQSDSGYSSHTAATMSSADSAPSSQSSQSPPAAPASAASIPPPSPPTSTTTTTMTPTTTTTTTKRRPTLVTNDRKSSSRHHQQSPGKPLQRSSSVSSKRPPGSRRPTMTSADGVCRDPNCTKCGPNALSYRVRRTDPSDSGLELSYAPSQRSEPAPSYRSPSSPTYNRQPAPYVQGSALVQPAQTRRRTSSSASRRPLSYQGDPGSGYWVPGMSAPYPSPPQEHGPPLSMSAHYNNMHHPSQIAPYTMMGATPPSYFTRPNPMVQMSQMAQISPPYDQRPPLSARNSSNYQTRGRPASALITYDQPMPSARYGDVPQSAREARFPPQKFHPESSSDYSSSEDEDEPPARNNRALMPPPKLKSSIKERPLLRHAQTTQAVNRRRESLSQSQTLPERPKERDPRASRISTPDPSRTASVSRRHRPTALIQHTQPAQEAPRPGKVILENSRSNRTSYHTYDRDYDQAREYIAEQKRRNRDSKIYYHDDRDDRQDAILVPERSRRRTDASVRRDEYIAPVKEKQTAMDAEAYQQRARGSIDPLADSIHKIAKRASRVPSGPSEGSSHSDDRKTRTSQSNRTTVTSGGANGEIRLRVDASAPLSLSFNGDMEGRTLQINPAEDGMADIVIGSSRGNEVSYTSERGSIAGDRRSRIAGSVRRDAEELSTRSSRASQIRREGDRERRVLRQRRNTNYH